uniref:Uncharacterized protein n=1 Tax=Ananas comosus var. bracteatus TaxID=296719 RepID=A0A6V7PTC6_ANACO|nr:unnamed protein product [Ananas comosus var. bracteatus]
MRVLEVLLMVAVAVVAGCGLSCHGDANPPPHLYLPSAVLRRRLPPLTFFDAAWLFTGPSSTSSSMPSPTPPPTSSPTSSPTRFLPLPRPPPLPPLLGRIRPAAAADGVDFAFAFSCSNDSVPLTVAESSDGFDALSSPGPRDFANLHALIPQLPQPSDSSIPLTTVQVTVFPRRGVALGIAIHHAVCDDSSFLHFVKSWAAVCKLGGAVGFQFPFPFPPPPSFDRGAIPDPTGLRAKTLAELTRPP